MSNVVPLTCTDVHLLRVKDHLEELQQADPEAGHTITTATDNLLHLGYMLSRLPENERQEISLRASEIIAGGE